MTKEELKKEAEEYALKQWEGNLPWSVIQKSYYDGALPREKRIAELEQENAELKENNQFLNNLAKEKEQRGLEVQEDLLKEIVELKRDKEDLIFVRNQKADYINELKDQLTKAKELFEELYDCIPSSSADYYKETLQKVADFLKDSEVEK